MTTLARYHLVELHRPGDGWGELQAVAARARSAAEELSAEGTPVRFLRSIFVPDDETCFHLFEGTTAAVAEASSRAEIAFELIVESVDLGEIRRSVRDAASVRGAGRSPRLDERVPRPRQGSRKYAPTSRYDSVDNPTSESDGS